MQPLGVVDVADELAQVHLGISECLVVVQVHLLAFERLEEALGLGIVVRVTAGGHADAGTRIKQPGGVGGAGILDAAIRVMNQPGWGATCGECRIPQKRRPTAKRE